MSGWGFTDRPAVTVGNAVGRGLIGGSGAKAAVVKGLTAGTFLPSVHATDTSYAEQTRITVREAAILQSYPPFLDSTPAAQLGGVALDLFAGHGWGVACQRLGIYELGVEIMPEAVATRELNGMRTIYGDVWEGLTRPDIALRRQPRLLDDEQQAAVRRTLAKPIESWNWYDLLIGSPPCQTFSMAGSGAGRAALDDVLAVIAAEGYKDVQHLHQLAEDHDPKTALVLTPLAHVWRDRPRYVVLEQVPTVLPVWQACAEVMRGLGYSVWVGILSAEQFGVPQVRKRAVLMASLEREAVPPVPTHSRYYSSNPAKLDEGVLPWVSMAEGLGWGMTGRPYPTVASGTERGGGTDPAALGGSGARRSVMAERDAGRWLAVRTGMGQGMIDRHGARNGRPVDQPAFTVVGGLGGNSQPGFGVRHEADDAVIRLQPNEAAALQSYPDGFQFAGGRGKQFLQIGNAVPPLLAEAILRALIG